MNSIMITLKTNMVTTRDYYSEVLTVKCMKLKLKMFIKILVAIKNCLILAIPLCENTKMIQINLSLEK